MGCCYLELPIPGWCLLLCRSQRNGAVHGAGSRSSTGEHGLAPDTCPAGCNASMQPVLGPPRAPACAPSPALRLLCGLKLVPFPPALHGAELQLGVSLMWGLSTHGEGDQL